MLLALILLLSLRYGSETLSFADMHRALQPADSHYLALVEYRLLRILLALLVGPRWRSLGAGARGYRQSARLARDPRRSSCRRVDVDRRAHAVSWPVSDVAATAGLYWRTAGLWLCCGWPQATAPPPTPGAAGYCLDCAVCQHHRLFGAVTSAGDQSGINVAQRQPVGVAGPLSMSPSLGCCCYYHSVCCRAARWIC